MLLRARLYRQVLLPTPPSLNALHRWSNSIQLKRSPLAASKYRGQWGTKERNSTDIRYNNLTTNIECFATLTEYKRSHTQKHNDLGDEVEWMCWLLLPTWGWLGKIHGAIIVNRKSGLYTSWSSTEIRIVMWLFHENAWALLILGITPSLLIPDRHYSFLSGLDRLFAGW